MLNLTTEADSSSASSSSDMAYFYSHVYFVVSLVLILVGIVVNLIVITTYKLGEHKKLVGSANASLNAICVNKVQNSKRAAAAAAMAANRDQSVPANLALLASTNNLASCNTHARHMSLSIAVKQQQPQAQTTVVDSNNKSRKSGFDKNDLAFGPHATANTTANTTSAAFHKIRKTLCTFFIVSLGFCDLFICLVNMPFFLVVESGLFNRLILEFVMSRASTFLMRSCLCRLAYFLVQIPFTVEIVILLTIALDRYLSVLDPMKSHFSFNKKMFKFTLIGHVAFSCLLSLPNFFLYEFAASRDVTPLLARTNDSADKLFFISLSTLCPVYAPYAAYHTAYNVVLCVLFSLNLLVIIVCYMRVYKHVYKVSKTHRQDSFMVTNTLQYYSDKNYLNNR
jgi:hypothetical protein